MRGALRQAVERWLALERSADDAGSEQALAAVVARLPVVHMPPGFARAVLARAGLAPAQPALAVRLAVASGIGLCAVAVMLLPSWFAGGAALLGDGGMLELVAGALVGLLRRLGEGIAVWKMLADVGRIVSSALDSPQMLAAVAFCSLISLGAFRVLSSLLAGEPSYARSR